MFQVKSYTKKLGHHRAFILAGNVIIAKTKEVGCELTKTRIWGKMNGNTEEIMGCKKGGGKPVKK